MAKTKTSKKQKAFSINDLTPMKVKRGVKTKPHDPDKNLRDAKFMKEAIMDALWSGDTDTMKELIKAHFKAIDLDEALEKSSLKRRTFYEAISKKGNPRVGTLSKIFSAIKKAG